MNSSDAIRIVLDMILEGKKDEAVALLNAYALEYGYRSIVKTILEPILKEIGNRWSKEHLSLAQGYVAGKVAEEILLRLKDEESLSTAVTTLKGPVILGNIEDDYHSLGRKMVSIFLEAAGWKVIDLGNDVTAKSFVDEATASGARIIGVSAMMYTTAANITKVRAELDKRGLSNYIQLAVGGAVFKMRPELAQKVGGDGTAGDAFEAPALFDALWNRALSWNSSFYNPDRNGAPL